MSEATVNAVLDWFREKKCTSKSWKKTLKTIVGNDEVRESACLSLTRGPVFLQTIAPLVAFLAAYNGQSGVLKLCETTFNVDLAAPLVVPMCVACAICYRPYKSEEEEPHMTTSALHGAASGGHVSTMMSLIANGANPTFLDSVSCVKFNGVNLCVYGLNRTGTLLRVGTQSRPWRRDTDI